MTDVNIEADLVKDAVGDSEAVVMEESWHNGTTLDEDSLIEILEVLGDSDTGAFLSFTCEVVVPSFSRWESISNLLHLDGFEGVGGSCDLRGDEHRVSEHELRFHGEEFSGIWELEPHGTHERLTSLGGSVEGSVKIVDHIVSSVDGISDNLLDSLSLDPWLSVNVVDIAVSSEEWHIHTSLVHTYPHFLRGCTNEAWDVSTSEDVATKSILHDHLDRTKDFFVFSIVVTSPVSTIFLRTKEVGASQDKWSQGSFVAIDKSLVAHLLLSGTIGVMELTMLNFFAIGTDMLGSSWDRLALL